MIKSALFKSETPPGRCNRPDKAEKQSKKNSGLAVASVVCSYLGLFICLFLGPMLGVYFGYRALVEIKNSNGSLGGEGLARSGITAGWAGTAIHVVLLFFIVLFASGAFSSIIPWLQ